MDCPKEKAREAKRKNCRPTVKDVAQANILAAISDVTGPVNVGAGKTTSVNKLAEVLIKLTGNQPNDICPLHVEPRLADPRQSQADISRIQAFGYNPHYTLEEGLKITCEYFKSVIPVT